MNVKLTIKETKIRELTEEEKIMVDVCKLLGQNMDLKSIANVCRNYLANRGIIVADGCTYELETPSSTTTIRDATPEEIIAWHCIGIAKMCGVMEWCMDCPKSKEDFLCYRLGEARVAEEFLKNKEVILELVD